MMFVAISALGSVRSAHGIHWQHDPDTIRRLTLHPLCIRTQEWSGTGAAMEDMSVAQLSSMLQQRGVRCVGCIEKDDFLSKLREADDMVVEAAPKAGAAGLLEVKYCMS